MATIAPKTRRPTARRTAYRHVNRVEVYLWDQLIGAVALDPSYGYYAFAWAPDFIESGVEPAPLHMPTSTAGTFIFPNLPELTYKRLPAMLADALPDDFGNALIDRYMAEQGISAATVTPLDRLAYMNSRAMGALTFKPARGGHKHVPTSIKLSELVDEARKAVHGVALDDEGRNAALRNIIDVGTSAGGARAKAVIALNPATREILSGQVDVPEGFEHWLLKFDGIGPDRELGASQGYGRIEYAYYLMARAAKIDMSPCDLFMENGRAHFMTRRFDREFDRNAGNIRHHMQTLCAMAHLDYKKKSANAYAQLFGTIRDLDLPYEAMEEAFRRMVFNVMGRNCDDHTKNFSFRLRRGKPWELAPAYDVTFAHNPTGEWTHQHLMSVNGKFKDFTVDDLLAEAELFGIGTAPRVISEVRGAIARWPEFASIAGVDAVEASKIESLLLLLD